MCVNCGLFQSVYVPETMEVVAIPAEIQTMGQFAAALKGIT